ncbi:helix-turn-helix transcriptional regulator [Listeria monocytogenes]|nr:helix-turn-helix transcriptional regulator [Listeria monocytogenes]EHC6355045.1 helix-turn-helix transcriptional regulator [Listeria monocytogenes]EID6355249.1 helix-turn-helix transcriptional regulator [Listeria monocytogenes]
MKNNNLSDARKEKGLTQQELAEKLQVRKSTVSNWETGYSSPGINTAIQTAIILNKDVSFLFGKEVQETHTRVGD